VRRSVEFHPAAQAELTSAAQFYERQTGGLGLDFLLTVQRTYERLVDIPRSGAPLGRRLRRVLVPKFPYGLLYRIEPARIYIVAVMHLHRRPGYWRSRL
jgi:plasmid stabilization system protein ParE